MANIVTLYLNNGIRVVGDYAALEKLGFIKGNSK